MLFLFRLSYWKPRLVYSMSCSEMKTELNLPMGAMLKAVHKKTGYPYGCFPPVTERLAEYGPVYAQPRLDLMMLFFPDFSKYIQS